MLEFALGFTALAAWSLVYFYAVRPKLHAYRRTAGIYQKLDAFEGPLIQRFLLRIKGGKVAIVGILASAVPVLGPMVAQLDGVDWSKILPTEKAQIVVSILGFVSAVMPLVMIVLHQTGLLDAARMEPCRHDHDHDGE